jgi:hypothetical protein
LDVVLGLELGCDTLDGSHDMYMYLYTYRGRRDYRRMNDATVQAHVLCIVDTSNVTHALHSTWEDGVTIVKGMQLSFPSTKAIPSSPIPPQLVIVYVQ